MQLVVFLSSGLLCHYNYDVAVNNMNTVNWWLTVFILSALCRTLSADLQWTDEQGSDVSITWIQNSQAELLCPTNMQAVRNITFYKDGKHFDKRPLGKIVRLRNGIKLPEVLAQFDKGNYTCVVSSPPYEIRRHFDVNIIIQYRGPPEFTLVPENKTVYEGENAEFACRFITGETAYVQWLKHYMVNGSYFNENKTAYFEKIQGGTSNMEKLFIRNVTDENAGWYTCVVTNKYGQIHRGAWLDVIHQPTKSVVSDYTVLIISSTILSFMLLVCIAIGVYIKHHCWQPKQRQLLLNQSPLYYRTLNLQIDTQWEFSRQNLQLGEFLGEGAFGKVYKGYALGINGHMEPTVVAVKMLKDGACEKEVADLLQEMEMMKSIGPHINIINFLGCCTRNDGPLQVLVEFAPNGNLRDFLRQCLPFELAESLRDDLSRPLGTLCPLPYNNLVSFAFQVSRGMQYLASMKIVHRDLAARNVLVADDNILKIADFGLTRNVKDKEYYLRSADGRLPVKWMAPESLIESRYTTKSDVWSFGILLWEIFSFGSSPYPTVAVEQLFQLLRQGYRMDKPPYATDDIYNVMLHCWKYSPPDRPEFTMLVHTLDDMLSKSVGINYLNLEPLRDMNEVTDNEVFHGVYETHRLLPTSNDIALTHSTDSQYVSLTTCEPTSSRSLSLISDTMSINSVPDDSLSVLSSK